MTMRILLSLAALAISFGPCVIAQTAMSGTQPFFAPEPPAGFDPEGASDADLKAYGFPPRPSLASSGYDMWVKMVTAAKIRIPNPTFQTTGLVHRPPQNLGGGGPIGGSGTSYNWSGVYEDGSSDNYFAANGSTIATVFSVPAVNSSPEDCTYGPYIASIWIGFDGWIPGGTGDVLQAGVDASACQIYDSTLNIYVPAYSPYEFWFEWEVSGCTMSQYACYETATNFQPNEGDTVIIDVTYYTSSPNANAYIADYTSGQYVSVWYDEPDNGTYTGNSAEWIVERPGIITSYPSPYYDLAAYESFYMEGTYDGYLPGSGPASGPNYLTMECTTSYPWYPSTSCSNDTVLSQVSTVNPDSGEFTFTPGGPAN